MISMSFTMGQCEITGKPEVIPADPIRIITSGLPTIRSQRDCQAGPCSGWSLDALTFDLS
jgi:hypothetical protein